LFERRSQVLSLNERGWTVRVLQVTLLAACRLLSLTYSYVIEGFRRGRNVAYNFLGRCPASFFGV
jgi:hypothetical protein